jgi:Yip1 domain
MSSPTPPPPSFAPAPASMTPEPQEPGLSEPARLLNTFISPTKTFADLRRNERWWVAWLVGAVLAVLFGVAAGQKADLMHIARQQVEQSKFAQRQFDQLSPEQQEQQLRIRATATKIIFYAAPVFNLISGLICAAILMAIFSFGFGAEVPFPRAMAIVFYSFLPRAVYSTLLAVSLVFASDPSSIDLLGNPMPTNAGFFMDPQGNKFIYSFMSNLDLFAIWSVVLLGLGFATASSNRKLKPGTAIGTMLAIYFVLILIGAALKSVF